MPAEEIQPKTITIHDAPASNAEGTPVWGEETVTLLFPLKTASGGVITSLTLREPNAVDLEEIEARARNKLNYAAVRETVAILSGVSVDDLKGLNVRDVKALAEVAAPLMGMEEPPKT